jgi:hypothetical protein
MLWDTRKPLPGNAENNYRNRGTIPIGWKRQLKERLGPRPEEAIIMYAGEHAYTHDDWITILPLDRLWAST